MMNLSKSLSMNQGMSQSKNQSKSLSMNQGMSQSKNQSMSQSKMMLVS